MTPLPARLLDQANERERALAPVEHLAPHLTAQARAWIADLREAAAILQRPTWWRRAWRWWFGPLTDEEREEMMVW